MLHDSIVAAVARTRPRAIPLAMIHLRKSIYGFPLVPLYGYGAKLGSFSAAGAPLKRLLHYKITENVVKTKVLNKFLPYF